MAILNAQIANESGSALTFAAAAIAGDSYVNSGTQKVIFRNDGIADKTVTIDSPNTCNFGLSAHPNHDRVITIPALSLTYCGPFDPQRFNAVGDVVNMTYSDVLGLFVAVVL